MIQARWRKVFKDLWANRGRTILVVLSIAVGVFAVGWNTTTFNLLFEDLDADYLSVNPRSAILYSQPFDDAMLKIVEDIPEVAEAEGRINIVLRIKDSNDQWQPVNITAIGNIEKMKIDQIRPLEGDKPLSLGNQEIFIERTGLSRLGVAPGDTVEVLTSEQKVRRIRVAAIVHDVTMISSVMTGQINAYVNQNTMKWLGGPEEYNQLYFTVAEHKTDEEYVKSVAEIAENKLQKSGRIVYITLVYEPGRHPTKSVSQTLSVIMGFFGAMAVLFSAFLVFNTVNALLSQQIRQIGVMKSVGATSRQIMAMYLVMVLCFGMLALLIAVPLSTLASMFMLRFLGDFLNFIPGGFRIPVQSLFLQIAVGLFVPVLGTLVPVLNGAGISIREAISEYGLGKGQFGGSRIDRIIEKVTILPRPFIISLRNTFRRKGRISLTLITLMLGGAIFIGIINVQSSFRLMIDEVLNYFLSDVNVSLNQSIRIERMEEISRTIPGVTRIEGWEITTAQILAVDNKTGMDILIWAPPADSDLIQPVITHGRWLLPQDQNGIVLSHHVIKERPDIQVGDEIITRIGNKEYPWVVVGICEMAGNFVPPFVYANYPHLVTLLNNHGRASSFRVVTDKSDIDTQMSVAKNFENRLTAEGIGIGSITTGMENRSQQMVTINILVYSLLLMSILMAVVGGIGLMGTMSLNVIERTREIGVMRSIGGTNGIILSMVVAEGMLIGLISWVLGGILAFPITLIMANVIGFSFVNSALPFVYGVDGLLIWLASVLVISAIASILPARNAIKLTIRDILAYE